MWKKCYNLYCDNCKDYISIWFNHKPTIKIIRMFAKVVYNNGKPTILCESCFNKLNNK